MRRLLTAVALAAGMPLPAVGATGASADSRDDKYTGVGIRLVDAPTATADDPRARAYVIDHFAPGSVIKRRVEVTNGTRTQARVSMYAAAAAISNGDFVGGTGRARNALSTWTSTSPRTVTLASLGKAFVTVAIRVLDDASPGERYDAVWAETTSTPRVEGAQSPR